MTINIDHVNKDRSEDPGYWYLWSLDFCNTFKLLFSHSEKFLQSKSHNIDRMSPLASGIVMWHIYAQCLELYMKTYLLAINSLQINELRSKKYGHDLEKLRKKCAESETRFNNKQLAWITQDIRKFTKIDWEYIKYPPKRSPLSEKSKTEENQHLPGMFGREVMIPPLDLLDEIIKPLVYNHD